MWKGIKSIIIGGILFVCLAVMTVAFGYGYDYFNSEYQDRVEAAQKKAAQVNTLGYVEQLDSSLQPSLLLAEVAEGQSGDKVWNNLYAVSEDGERYLLIEPRQPISTIAQPVLAGQKLFYYALGRDHGQEVVTLRSYDLESQRDEMIVTGDREESLRGLWASLDGEIITYQKFNPATDLASYWDYDVEHKVFDEIVVAEEGLYPTPHQTWSANSDRFYFTKNVGLDSYVLYEAREAMVSSAFPAFRWDRVDWEDMWEVEPLAVSPDGLTALYLDRHFEGESAIKTDVNIIDQSGGITNLISLPGNIYELAWSPSGKKIAFNFASYEDGGMREKAEIWLMDGSGDNPQRVYVTEQEAMIHDLHWDRSGRQVFFVERQPESYSLVQALSVDGGKTQTLERYLASNKGSHLRILDRLDMLKALDWQER